MELDLHYYGIGFLARAAGLPKKDALTIAYASQYVDDSTESALINCGDFKFDPVRTAHNGLGAWEWTINRKIHMPFHFLPADPMTSKPDAFVTKPDSPMSRKVLDNALNQTDRESKMIAIGIALHTYADTWAHQGFTGRDDKLNDVSNIQYKSGQTWVDPFLENLALDLLPCVGHAQAACYPDFPWLEWRYTNEGTGKSVNRNNLNIFLDAAKTIHAFLCSLPEATESIHAWTSIVKEVKEVLSYEDIRMELRIRKWTELYTKCFGNSQGFKYDRRIWRNEAFIQDKSSSTAWDSMTREDLQAIVFKPKKTFWDSRWVKFHQNALKQRNFVLQELW